MRAITWVPRHPPRAFSSVSTRRSLKSFEYVLEVVRDLIEFCTIRRLDGKFFLIIVKRVLLGPMEIGI